jgi:DNA repair protein RadC
MSDVNLVASLVADSGAAGRASNRALAAQLNRLGLAGLAHRPASRWPRDLGLDEEGRRRLSLALELGRRVYAAGGPALTHPADVYQWCVDLREADRERFIALYLDARRRVLRRRLVSIGTLTASLVHPREVLGPALRIRAAALVVVHNHPSGDPEPSPEDCALTDRLRDGCRLLGLELLDHVVVARDGFVSLRERGLL